MYKLRMDLFDNGNLEEFILLMQNIKIIFETSGALTSNTKLQYFHTLLRGEALLEFEILCVQIGNTKMNHINQVILG